MRYLVRIAESREPSSFSTQVAPEAIWLRARLPGCHTKSPCPQNWEGADSGLPVALSSLPDGRNESRQQETPR
ncbi:hypothetical protein LINPERHAP1_LOCUS10848 [Linum perenne]